MALLMHGGHGGNVHAASRELRQDIDRLVDFSASINPLGPSPRALHALARANRLVHHYPDPDCWALRQALASRWRLPPDRIVVGNGSTEFIHLLPLALRLRHLLIVGPIFSEYAKAMARTGGQVSMVMADRAAGYAQPIEQVLKAVRTSGRRPNSARSLDAVVLCNPNSPTGQVCDAATVMKLGQIAERRGIHLIVDETFAEYCEERSILPHADMPSRVIVLRSFTKFHGLPGLRVGYLVAGAESARQVRAHQPPWSVNALAQEAALAALNDKRHAQRSRSFMTKERARFMALLRTVRGCYVFPSHANFVLMELSDGWQAKAVTARLRRKGLLIRDCSTVPGLNAGSVRVAVRRKPENDRLVRALSDVLGRG